jgi:hypothetical protein
MRRRENTMPAISTDSRFNSQRVEIYQVVQINNDIIQKELETYKSTLKKETDLEATKDSLVLNSLDSRLKKMNNFRQFQYDVELDEQVKYLKHLIELYLKKKHDKTNSLQQFISSNKNRHQRRQLLNYQQPFVINIEKIEASRSFQLIKKKLKYDLLKKFNLPLTPDDNFIDDSVVLDPKYELNEEESMVNLNFIFIKK